MYAFEGDPHTSQGMLFHFLNSLPGSLGNQDYEQIANMVFATAMENINIVSLLEKSFSRVYDAAFRDGKTEVQNNIKDVLGI